jgi:nitrate/TMAO reductase-like tetraheme cytochrome c subunit
MKNKRNLFLTLIFAVPLVVIFSQCLTSANEKPDPRGDIFAGSESCIKCHKNVYDNYIHTAHFTTSRPAFANTINGSFAANANTFYFNKDSKVVMEKRKSGLFQVAYFKGQQVGTAPFDIAFGGVKAESYLYWKGNEVYQLPMSYFGALHNWTNSPGFDTTHADYNRMIGRRCFECHSSYIKDLPLQTQNINHPEEFDKGSLIFGIDCERCHGPAANHVNYHLAYPDVKKPMYIKTYASLTRPQKIDMCATCHSGNKSRMLKSIFTFKPGDNLADFKEVAFVRQNLDSAKMDVHGNQTQLLESSKCFAMTSMNCSTCHDVHKNQRQNVAMYSQTCVTCHSAASHNVCTMTAKIGGMIKNNCIDCHMPARASNVIQVQVSGGGKAIPYLVRTHHIAIYKDASNLVMSDLKKYNLLP